MRQAVLTVFAAVLAAAPAYAARCGDRVNLTVEIDGAPAPLYDAPDSSGRFYLEAKAGARYTLNVTNRTGERVGVSLTVDGLNVISGDRAGRGPGRMYILDAWETTVVQGWRTSLEEVRRFTFVDEKASYAARVGKANPKMGWIEMAVYRERPSPEVRRRQDSAEADKRAKAEPAPADEARAAAPAPPASSARAEGEGGSRSYPGTGWGDRTEDRVTLVDFRAESSPVETATLRYEYAPALRALGILVPRVPDRLRQRDRAEGGFAPPPRW